MNNFSKLNLMLLHIIIIIRNIKLNLLPPQNELVCSTSHRRSKGFLIGGGGAQYEITHRVVSNL